MALRWLGPTLGATPNVELITVAGFLAVGLLPRRVAWAVPLLAAAASDALIGNSGALMLWTWSAWLLVGCGTLLARRVSAASGWPRRLAGAAGVGAGSAVFFYLWTNLGFWLGWRAWFAPGWAGLLEAYVAGLPFLRNQLVANLVLLPLAALVLALVTRTMTVSATSASARRQRLARAANKC